VKEVFRGLDLESISGRKCGGIFECTYEESTKKEKGGSERGRRTTKDPKGGGGEGVWGPRFLLTTGESAGVGGTLCIGWVEPLEKRECRGLNVGKSRGGVANRVQLTQQPGVIVSKK